MFEQQDTEREFVQLMLKNKERGVLTDPTITRLKRLGFNIEESEIEEEQGQTKSQKSGALQLLKKFIKRQHDNNSEIKDKEWRPESLIFHTDEFFNWINSMTFGFFPEKSFYEKFEKYKAQAQYWIETAKDPYSTDNTDLRREIVWQEYNRVERNTLYYAMKYGWVKEGSVREGKIPYVPKEHNAVIFYLLDCGYLLIIGKPRQIFATTTIGLFINKKLLTQENFYMKFITEDVDTGMEILSDRVKVPYGYHPGFMRPSVSRDYIKGFKLGKKIEKGEFAVPNSRIEVVAPTKTAINGGSPQFVLVDEIGNVPDLIPMILEALPTLYTDPNQDGNLQLTRGLVLWGTGVSDNKGKNGYQSLWTNTLNLWEKKKFKSSLLVPLFLSWHTRCSKEVYDQSQLSYYSGGIEELQGYSAEEQKNIFHMHFPSVWRDMFSMASNKLVGRDIIEGNLSRIRVLPETERVVHGFFEPIFDRTVKYDENIGVPYKVIGSKFIPYDDNVEYADKVSASLLHSPDKEWVDRYYQGTDPIGTDTGYSKFGSAIWDEHLKTIACLINYRKSQDHKAAYVQALLMSLYYDRNPNGNKKGVPELIENNIGTNYKWFKELLGYDENVVYNRELPMDLQGGGALWGVQSQSKRKELVVSELSEMARTYGGNINHSIFFQQLDTYVPEQKQNHINWRPVDKRLYNDDVLDASAYAYICRKCFANVSPRKEEEARKENNLKVEWVEVRLPNGNLTRMPQQIRA